MARAAALVPALLALALCAFATPAGAGTFEFHATADTYVDSGSPKKAYGTSNRVWSNGGIPVNQTLVRFKVTGLTGPVTDAVLRFYVTDKTGDGPAVYKTTNEWSEKTTNWNNRPSRTSGPRDDKGFLADARWVKWDVTPWVGDDGTVSFMIRGGAGDAVRFGSRESVRDPELVITTTDNLPPLTACADGNDNDGDGLIDLTDPGCWGPGDTSEENAPPPPPAACADLVDNDHDGLVDLADPGCSGPSDTDETNAPPPPPAACADGTDNDGDGEVDFPADPGCTGLTDDDETNALTFGEPLAIAGQGYRQVFRDDFSGTVLDPAVWTPKEFWEDDPRPGAVVVSDGTVKIRNARPYIDDQSITTGPSWGADDPVKKAWKFGYFEARMRFTDAKGSWPAFWLISEAHATWPNWPACPEPDLNFELDIMEYQGDEPTQFYGTEHRNTGDVCGTADNTRSVFTKPGKLAGGWHTFSVLWTATSVTWYVDDVQQGAPQPLWDSGDQRMFISLTMQACGWDSTNACGSTTANPLETEVDYVDVWQK